MPCRYAHALVALLLAPMAARAGLCASGETYAALPAQWRGFLLDQRSLRNVAAKPAAGQDASPLRVKYLKEAQRLQQRLDREHMQPPDAWAAPGALLVRLGEPAKAVAVLRGAQRAFPNHFAVAANL